MGGKWKWALGGLGLLALAGAYVYVGVDIGPHEEYVPDPVVVAAVEDTVPDPPSAYGIPLDGFVIERGKVSEGSTFSDLLVPHGISPGQIDSLVKLAAPVFEVRKLRAGHPYALI